MKNKSLKPQQGVIFLYSSGKKEDVLAYRLLTEAGIPFKNFGGVRGEQTPYIECGIWKYIGLSEIKKFIEAYGSLEGKGAGV